MELQLLAPHEFPKALKALRQWVIWSKEPNPGKPKPKKLLREPWSPFKNAKSTASESWGSLGQARAALTQFPRAQGLGFVFTAGIIGIDLDDVYLHGVLHPVAQEIVDLFSSYCELSPSGTGLHIFVRGNWNSYNVVNLPFRIEVYEKERYFTFTGQHLLESPRQIEDRYVELLRFEERFFPVKPLPKAAPRASSGFKVLEIDDVKVIERVISCKNGARYSRLLAGDTVGAGCVHATTGEPDLSRADLTLCNALYYFTGWDRERTDRLYRNSGLYRAKWLQKATGDGRLYGELTLDKVERSAIKKFVPR